jgi:ATP-dependent Lon protease
MLLETLSVEERLRRVLVHMQRQIQMLQAQEQIKHDVAEEIGGRQRELYLREQLKAIQKELGESGDDKDFADLRERLTKLELPAEARVEVDRELARLERSGRESMEAQVIRTYLQWISELPWNTRSDDSLDLVRAARVLEEDHYGLKDVKDRVLEFLSVRLLKAKAAAQAPGESPSPPIDSSARPDNGSAEPASDEARGSKARALAHGPILLFVGPPGVGKTSIAQSIARALGRKYVRVALGGARDEADIRGHRRTYVGALPGRIIHGMKQAGTKNPVFLLDEVDKLGVSFQGDPASALLEVLDPEQNNTFTDHYLGVPFDLSEVLFIATGNYIHNIPGPLLDRTEVVEFAGYTEREKVEIARRYLIPRQLAESGLTPSYRFTDEAMMVLVSSYTRESGVRQLERQIGAVARKLARKLAAGESVADTITAEQVRELLGRPRVRPEHAGEADEVGIATGMYYSAAGGDIMFVEAAVRRRSQLAVAPGSDLVGDVSLILTGQLGEVMKESARAALTYATTRAAELRIPPECLGSIEVHIHVPAGAIPKDGPSAGVTMATAVVSAMSGRPVHKDLAMTGEITLSGRVLPIGGVKEKVLGAHRAGIRRVLLPRDNEPDLEDVPPEVRDELEFYPVSRLEEVLELALLPAGGSHPRAGLEEAAH